MKKNTTLGPKERRKEKKVGKKTQIPDLLSQTESDINTSMYEKGCT